MAGNPRDLTSSSPNSGSMGNYPKGGPSLDRSGSFRDVGESRTFGYARSSSRMNGASAGYLPPLSQCLKLGPVVMADQKHKRFAELTKVLGFPAGGPSEGNSLAASALKLSDTVDVETVKHIRASIADRRGEASGIAKKIGENLHKLNRYEVMTSKKQQQIEVLANERLGSASLKIGTPFQRTPSDPLTQKSEDRPKNANMNKRVRTSVAETRVDCRSSGLPRQPLALMKGRDMLKENNVDSGTASEKIRGLPAGEEGWEKKMKRRRSTGTITARSMDSDGDMKRHQKLTTEPVLQSCESHGIRSGASVSGSCNTKLEGNSSPSSSSSRATLKIEQEKSTLSRDQVIGVNKEKVLAKGSIRLNNRESNYGGCPSPVTKGKASRTPRGGLAIGANSPSSLPRPCGALESCEEPPTVNKSPNTSGSNNRKRPLPPGSSSPPITQWVGQRPQKISRTRRANLVSPVTDHDEIQMSSEGCSPSDFGSRLTSIVANGSLSSKAAANGTQNFRVRPEIVSSPARLSGSEESGGSEIKTKEKIIDGAELEEKTVNIIHNPGLSTLLMKKNKFLTKDEAGDGTLRQGRCGRGTPGRDSICPVREKLDYAVTSKPPRGARSGSDRNRSKSGRPLKKLSDRKGFSRLGHVTNKGSPDLTAEMDDDQEELLAAANSVCSSALLACSSAFWKKVEPLFAKIGIEEKSYISEQVKLADQLQENLSQMNGLGNDILADLMDEEISSTMKIKLKDSPVTTVPVNQLHDSISSGKMDSERLFDKNPPLYQRILSALIVEDDIEEYEENGFARALSFHNARRNSSTDLHVIIEAESKDGDKMELECKSIYGIQSQSNGISNRLFYCNKTSSYNRGPHYRDLPCMGGMPRGDSGYVHSEAGVLVGLSTCDFDGPRSLQADGSDISFYDCRYEQMSANDKLLLELQSVGIYLENVPDLDDKDDEAINQEVMELKRELYQQISDKRTSLEKVSKAVGEQSESEGWDPMQIAMNKLVESAYRKLLATRGSFASKNGVPKVSRQVALAFSKRMLARCRKFEESGTSCFDEPALREIVFATPLRVNGTDVFTGSHPEAGSVDVFESLNQISEKSFAKNGPISNRGKKKEVLLDDVGCGAAFRATSTPGITLLAGAKGKRTERDTSTRSAVSKAGPSSMVDPKCERKTKTKSKQKTAQLSTSGVGYTNKFMETTNSVDSPVSVSGESLNSNRDKNRDTGLVSPGNVPCNSSKESTDLADLPQNDLDLPQDFNSWFNFDVDGLQEHDAVGLDIPMDDLSELNMF